VSCDLSSEGARGTLLINFMFKHYTYRDIRLIKLLKKRKTSTRRDIPLEYSDRPLLVPTTLAQSAAGFVKIRLIAVGILPSLFQLVPNC